MAKDLWTTVTLRPLIGPLDTRSRPADLSPGAFRWKLNLQTKPGGGPADGKLYRRPGHAKFFSDAVSFTNHDHHRQGATREPITGIFESNANDGTRKFFDFTQSRVSILDTDTGNYTDIITGLGATGSRWRAAELQNVVVLTNNVDAVRSYDLDSLVVAPIADLGTLAVTKAKLVVEFNGFILLMNIEQGGERQASRVLWCDLNRPTTFNPESGDTLSGFQDLDYGDEILGASPMLGALYIYTRRSIWRVTVSGDPESTFAFNRVYNEPLSQTGCLTFPNTLCSTGGAHYYMSRDGIYTFTPYIAVPERVDWIYLASGVIYEPLDKKIDLTFCESPVAAYRPQTRELWFSWASYGQLGINNWTLICQLEQKTADVMDEGWTCLGHFRRNIAEGQQCSEVQDFVGASNVDWCLKSIGGPFYREYAALTDADDPSVDLPAVATYSTLGYKSQMIGMIPLGLTDRDKKLRHVLLDHDTSAQDEPCMFRLKVGNSYAMVDPYDDEPSCGPLWRHLGDEAAKCPDPMTVAQFQAKNLRPNQGTHWHAYERGRFLYFDLSVINKDGTAAIGGEIYFQRIDFEAMAMPSNPY